MSDLALSPGVWLLQLAVLLCASFICGEVALRLRQPAVLGQLFAGILLGHSFLGWVMPDLENFLFPPNNPAQSSLLDAVSQLGVIFLVMLTGMEMNISLLRKQERAATFLTVIACIVPFIGGALTARLVPDSMLGAVADRNLLSFFFGTLFSMSSLPVVAGILTELGFLRHRCGQLIVASALIHDATGYILLGICAALVKSETVGSDIFRAIATPVYTILFLALLFLLKGRIYAGFRRVASRARTAYALLTMVASLVLLGASMTQFIGVHVILGAFAVGLVLSEVPLPEHAAHEPLKAICFGVLAPVFFAAAGINVNLQRFLNPEVALLALEFLFLASFCKIGGCIIGGLCGGLSIKESATVGIGANAFGAMGIVVGVVGRTMNLLSTDMFAVVVVMSVLSTMITPELLKRAFALLPVEIAEPDKEALNA